MKKKILSLVVIAFVLNAVFSPIFVRAMFGELSRSDMNQIEQTVISIENSSSSSVSKEANVKTGLAVIENVKESDQTLEDAVEISLVGEGESTDGLEEELGEGQMLDATNISSPEIVIVKNITTEEFIKTIGNQAEKVAFEYDLYASVMIAQAILESGSGNSGLSMAPYYNLFGIKGNYSGSTVVMKTQEDDGKGNLFTIDAGFRKYSSYKESLEDYAQLLKSGVSGDSEFYKGAWKSETRDFRNATIFLTGRYATDVQYSEKLDKLIDVYGLTSYDEYQGEEIKRNLEPEKMVRAETRVKEHVEDILRIDEIRTLIRRAVEEKRIKRREKWCGLILEGVGSCFTSIFMGVGI